MPRAVCSKHHQGKSVFFLLKTVFDGNTSHEPTFTWGGGVALSRRRHVYGDAERSQRGGCAQRFTEALNALHRKYDQYSMDQPAPKTQALG
jgi:hypothetical protein